MPEAPYDLKSNHPLLPHPEVTRLYKENNYLYYKSCHDINYENWYAATKKTGKVSDGKISIVINQMCRTKRMGKDYIFYDANLYGTDRTGNRLAFNTVFGTYQKPVFRKTIDQRTDEVISHDIESQETIYEYEYTPELFDSLLEQAVEESENQHLSLVVIGTRNYSITDPQQFRDATYQELIEIGKTGKSLATIRKGKEKVTPVIPN